MRDNRRVRDMAHRVIGSTAIYNFDMILGESRVMQDTRNKARSVGRSDSTVLLTGESGTGKELLLSQFITVVIVIQDLFSRLTVVLFLEISCRVNYLAMRMVHILVQSEVVQREIRAC